MDPRHPQIEPELAGTGSAAATGVAEPVRGRVALAGQPAAGEHRTVQVGGWRLQLDVPSDSLRDRVGSHGATRGLAPDAFARTMSRTQPIGSTEHRGQLKRPPLRRT